MFFIVNFYLPAWFEIKSKPHVQEGARHFQLVLNLSKDLCSEDRTIVHKVAQINSYWEHPENVIISCLVDDSKEI